MQNILNKFTLQDSYSKISIKSKGEKLCHFYLTFGFKSDIIAVYGIQGEPDHLNAFGNDVYTIDYINLYCYKGGAGVAQKIKQKERDGYKIDNSIVISKLHDRTSDKIRKINYLLYNIFSKETMTDELIQYINQISVIKFLCCSKDKELLKKHMTYMNEIYQAVK